MGCIRLSVRPRFYTKDVTLYDVSATLQLADQRHKCESGLSEFLKD